MVKHHPNGLEKWTDQGPFQATSHIPGTVDHFLEGLLPNPHALGSLLETGDIHGHNSAQRSSQPTATRHKQFSNSLCRRSTLLTIECFPCNRRLLRLSLSVQSVELETEDFKSSRSDHNLWPFQCCRCESSCVISRRVCATIRRTHFPLHLCDRGKEALRWRSGTSCMQVPSIMWLDALQLLSGFTQRQVIDYSWDTGVIRSPTCAALTTLTKDPTICPSIAAPRAETCATVRGFR